MAEHRIYNQELKYGDIQRIAEEFGTEAAYVSRAINGDDSPARRYARWFRAIRRVRPSCADRLHEWVLKQIEAEILADDRAKDWDQDTEVLQLFAEITEGFDAVLRKAPPRELRRELISDVRRKLDRWERQSICYAAKFKQDPRSPRKSAFDLFKAGVTVLDELCPLNGGVTDWDYIDQRRVQIQRNGITRMRPAFSKGWYASIQFSILTPEYIEPSFFNEVLITAGRLIGVADFRPTYGRFQITSFVVENS